MLTEFFSKIFNYYDYCTQIVDQILERMIICIIVQIFESDINDPEFMIQLPICSLILQQCFCPLYMLGPFARALSAMSNTALLITCVSSKMYDQVKLDAEITELSNNISKFQVQAFQLQIKCILQYVSGLSGSTSNDLYKFSQSSKSSCTLLNLCIIF
ncbi:Hypothetical_protein [Hexamita inflata]|uniref:Hypothetical_protein n=1 Tax=Hexamita inflata TaxID=28002 RepID=A0AA86USR0_9EUKA|nr:Hypothetical protein HINF_LOCUS54164 [Hexamita inflata]